jgi:hypothetical protein
MNTPDKTTRLALITGMMVLAAFSRLIPHAPNFTAVLAIALFGGAKFRNTVLAIIVPLLVMFITDLSNFAIQFGSTDIVIGFHSLMPLVYSCIAITSLIGIYISKKQGAGYIIGGSIVASTLFFLVTNAGVWYHNPQFTQDVQGLMACYTIAIPFYGNQLLGDLFFSGMLFGAYSLASKRIPVLKTN